MAAANILTTGSTDASSGDTVVAAGSRLTVALKDAAGPHVDADAAVHVLLKDDGGQYFHIDTLNPSRACIVIEAGTWRFTRVSGTCGVFSG